jgi:LAGLIDADG endonuclease
MSIGVLGFVVWSQWVAFLIGDYKVIYFTIGWNGYLFLFLITTSSICFTLVCLLFGFVLNLNLNLNLNLKGRLWLCLWLWLCIRTQQAIYIKLGNLLDTFYSLNANRNAQSAGNLSSTYAKQNHQVCLVYSKLEENPGSSETIRGNTYDLFKENYSFFFKDRFKRDNDWLAWFIGFSEGDGAILEHKGRSSFVITQKDDKVLHEIRETFNIGVVKHFYDNKGNKKYSRYIVSENKGIFLLYLLLNGNLRLESRVNQLSKWSIALNNASRFNFALFQTINIPNLIEKVKQPSLNDGWLSGFTDAEGCFSVKIEKREKASYVQLLFILDQKNGQEVLNSISTALNTKTRAKLRTVNKSISWATPTEEENRINYLNTMFRLSISCNDSKKSITRTILEYFNKYPLKTSKSQSFKAWTDISSIVLGKQPLSFENLKQVRKLRHNMNLFTIENKTIGHANKS